MKKKTFIHLEPFSIFHLISSTICGDKPKRLCFYFFFINLAMHFGSCLSTDMNNSFCLLFPTKAIFYKYQLYNNICKAYIFIHLFDSSHFTLQKSHHKTIIFRAFFHAGTYLSPTYLSHKHTIGKKFVGKKKSLRTCFFHIVNSCTTSKINVVQ